jgi:hypothetical protein
MQYVASTNTVYDIDHSLMDVRQYVLSLPGNPEHLLRVENKAYDVGDQWRVPNEGIRRRMESAPPCSNAVLRFIISRGRLVRLFSKLHTVATGILDLYNDRLDAPICPILCHGRFVGYWKDIAVHHEYHDFDCVLNDFDEVHSEEDEWVVVSSAARNLLAPWDYYDPRSFYPEVITREAMHDATVAAKAERKRKAASSRGQRYTDHVAN